MRVPGQDRCESVGDTGAELVWVRGRSLSGVSVGLWEGPCARSVWVCGRFLFGDTVGLSGVPVWGECGSVEVPVGLLGALHSSSAGSL